MIDPALVARAEAWAAVDPDPDTRAELAALLAAGDAVGLADRFSGRLAFGTAGLRAPMGAGPMRMNRVVVRQAAAGLVATLPAGARVVIGFDARHRSADFALDTARVVAAAGGRALLFPAVVPTPVLAHAVRRLGADAGVMCTASHNPPEDNGYKVYLADGAQIVPPADAAIAAAIDAVAAGPPPPLAPPDDPRIERLGPEVVEAYLAHVAGLVGPGPRDLCIVSTALHGVGGDALATVLRRAGFADVHAVAEQAAPDPDFPTVRFPNPEEPGALDLAVAEATRRGAQLVLANDPDADRLGVVVPDGVGGWRVLTGNEIGVLLADHLLAAGHGDDRLVVTTFVSSRLLARVAAAAGVHYAETLTGFKWIVRPALAHPEWRFVFGYEEALGFSVDAEVRDKDGIAAALVFADFAARLAAAGTSVPEHLDELARRHGLHATRTVAVRLDGPDQRARLAAVMAGLRAAPPTQLAGRAVVRMVDHATGTGLPPADALTLELADGGRVVVRPSGTEPKVKCYAEVVVAVPDGADGPARARAVAGPALDDLAGALDALVRTLAGSG